MLILGIDTSCEQASCAVYADGLVHERRSVVDKRRHSETLMPMVSTFLKEKGIKVSDIGLFAVSAGPGSFTGLRIGMAAVKGMAYSAKKSITVIKTTDVLANYFEEDKGVVCPVIDARNNQVYTAVYRFSDGFYKPVTEYMGIGIEELADMLRQYETVRFCGDAAMKHHEFFTKKGISCEDPDEAYIYPSAGVLVKMAAAGLGDLTDPSEAVPYYLRVSQAERFHGKG